MLVEWLYNRLACTAAAIRFDYPEFSPLPGVIVTLRAGIQVIGRATMTFGGRVGDGTCYKAKQKVLSEIKMPWIFMKIDHNY